MSTLRRTRGFTLVELLVVIGIIALLVSILLPALNKARMQAAMIKCQSNMRQMMLAVNIYASENKSQLPFCNWGGVNDNTVYGYGWLFARPDKRAAYLPYYQGTPERAVISGVLWQYIKDTRIYHCPLDDAPVRLGSNVMTSYLMNGAQCGYGRLGTRNNSPNVPGLRMVQVKHPGDAVLMWEVIEPGAGPQKLSGAPWNDGASQPAEESLSSRHYLGANVACVDGHVEWWDQSTWHNWVIFPKPAGRLWWSPFTKNGH
jgi:prepilin-type N-terminal cleavage/methylation domain-containing protein/prepilin-type processing-associated H-X9-DG protein